MKPINPTQKPKENRPVTRTQREDIKMDRGVLKVRCGGGFRIIKKSRSSSD